jgi:hypothetical protein
VPPVLSPRSRALKVGRFLGRHAEWIVAGIVLMVGANSVLTYDPGYVASATVVFVDTPTVEQYAIATQELIDPLSQSPLARFQDATIVGDVFARLYRSAGKLQQLRSDGLRGRLVITTKTSVLSDTPDHGPVFVMTVVAPTPATAEEGAALVLADVVAELAQQQAGYDPALSVGAAVLATPIEGSPVSGSRMRATFGFTMLALLLLISVRRVRLKIQAAR